MRNGIKIIDVDTHIDPSFDVLTKYMDPAFRDERASEFEPYIRAPGGGDRHLLSIAPYPFDRFPGRAPGQVKVEAGGRNALDGRISRSSTHHRLRPHAGVRDEESGGRLQDMDLEGRDIDFMIPGTWAAGVTGLPDPSLATGLYRAYHRYIGAYTQANPARLKSLILAPGADIEWAVAEVERLKNEPWVAAVWPMLPQDMPIDHPALDPLWDVMNAAHLPIIHHSFFYEPPYFPGYRDMWGNAAVARTAAHPWGAARLLSYLIVGQIFDRYPNINAGVSEVGHGWLPNWVIRLGEMIKYVSGTTPPLKYTPLEYVQMGRFRCGAEPFEGPEMTKAVIDILGEDVLMHQSDYPHAEAHFPDTAQIVMDWPFWADRSPEALAKHMSGNAEKFLRLV